MAQAIEEPPLPVGKSQVLIHYLDSAKNKFRNLAVPMLNGVTAFFKRYPPWVSMVVYVFCMGVAFMMWIVMGLLDLAAGTHSSETVIHVVEGLNENVLPTLQLLNGLLALLFGFSTLLSMLNINIDINDNNNRYRVDPNNNISCCRSKMIRALPEAKYGCLRISDDVNRSDSSPSSCAICLGCIGDDDRVRILPNCRHYFHILCIDRWLLRCPCNSSCPLCRATVISLPCSKKNLEAQIAHADAY